MPRANPYQPSFNGGQLSPYLEGRVDFDKYGIGCRIMKNFLPLIQGPATRRAGTRFVKAARDSSEDVALIPFEPRDGAAYMLEFGHNYIRFFFDRAIVLASGASAYNGGTSYSIDDYVTYLGLTYRSRVDSNVGNQPDTSPTQWEQTDHLVVTTPFDGADVAKIRYTQSIDVLYLAHPDHPPYKLSRLGAASFSLEEISFTGGPFLDQNTNESITVNASATTGTVTLTANSGIFSAGLVGSLIQLEARDLSGLEPWETNVSITAPAQVRNEGKVYESLTSATTGAVAPTHTSGDASDGGVAWRYRHDFIGVVRITGYSSSTVVTGTVIKRLPDQLVGTGNSTWRWSKGAWSDVEGYPSYVTFFRERLTYAKDDFIDMSYAQDFEDFTAREFGEVLPENAIRIRIIADQLPQIQWLSPKDQLIVGTTGGEFVVGEVTTNEPLGPDNVKASRETQYGSADAAPVQVGTATLFIQRENRKLREAVYSFEQDGLIAPDMTIISDQITSPGISEIVFQAEPNSVLWCKRDDGALVSFTYSREQNATGWAEHFLGGFSTAYGTPAKVISHATIPDPDQGRDDLWLAVERLIDGNVVKYIEYIERDYNALLDDQSEAFYVDCGLTYDEPLTITAVTSANPVQITVASHGLSTDDRINIRGIKWTYPGVPLANDLNGRKFRVEVLDSNNFTLTNFNGDDIDGTAFPAYVEGGEVRKLITTISGLDHVEGETLAVLTDGGTHPDVTVESGSITLQQPSGTVQIGYPYNSDLQTMRIEAGAARGTAQGKIKRISRIVVRVDNSGTFQYGPDENTLDRIIFRNASDFMDRPVPLYTGDAPEIAWNRGYERDGRQFFRQSDPLPLTLVSLMPEVNTQG